MVTVPPQNPHIEDWGTDHVQIPYIKNNNE